MLKKCFCERLMPSLDPGGVEEFIFKVNLVSRDRKLQMCQSN